MRPQLEFTPPDDELERLQLAEALDVEPGSPLESADFRMHQMRLGGILEFTPDDLAYNRGARLSPAQAERLYLMLRTRYWIIIGVLSASAFFAGLLGALSGGSLFGLIPMLICMALALGTAGLLNYARTSILDQPVESTTVRVGRIALTFKRMGSDKATFKLDDKHKLEADKQLYKVMRANQDYIAYYTQLVPFVPNYRIVSMEPIGDLEPDVARLESKPKRGMFSKRKR
ncbi:MAG TPA: hypothetical protein VHP83_07885 [Aggregatilineaceae bacterium]|nr:hypothetical protein [Aggregatilineaceae bacterium]